MKPLQRTLAAGLAGAFLALTLASCGMEEPTAPELQKAKEAYEAALANKTTATQQLTTAANTLSTDQAALTALKASQAEAEATLTQAVQDKADGEAAYQRSQEAVIKAEAKLEKLQREQNTLYQYRDSALGFFIWNASESGVDIETVTKMFLGNAASYNEVTPRLSDPKDATSFKNFKASVQWIEKCNEMRQRENRAEGTNLQPLRITDWAMIAAQLHADYSTTVIGHHGNTGSCKFNLGENLAWGDRSGPDGPFEAWYTKEKESYKLTPEWNNQTGHYLNIVNSSYKTTGFAISTRTDGRYSITYAQEFGFADYQHKSYTPSQYRARIAAYESFLNGLTTNLNTAEAAVTDAKAAETAARNKLAQLDAALTNAQNASKEAAAQLTALRQTIKADQAALAAAQEAVAQAEEAVITAKKALDAAQKALEEQQKSAANAA